jgi:hypothetical protein
MRKRSELTKAEKAAVDAALRRARKRGLLPLPTRLTQREKRVKAEIPKDLEAERAFHLFVKRGFAENPLLTLLCYEAWGPEVLWAREEHRRVPRRGEVTEMRNSLFREAKRLRRRARRVLFPHTARALNQAAGQAIREASLLRGPGWDRPSQRELRAQYTREFVREVERRTGYQSLKQVAALLRVTRRLAGRGDRVSRESLRSLLQ